MRRFAVAAGAGTALIALLQPVPVRVACLRGGMAWLGVRIAAWFIGWVLRQIDTLEHKQAEREARQLWEADQAAEASGSQGGAS